MKKKRIMFLLAAFDKGGIEKVTLDIANNLDPQRYDITIYTIWYGGHCQSLLKPHIKVKPFFFKKYVRGIIRLIDILPPHILYKLFIKEKYDVEIAAGDGECSKIVSGSNNRNSKKIAWIHMDVVKRGSMMKEFGNKETAKKIYNKFNQIVCVSEVCKEQFIKKFGKYNNIVTIYNPIPKSEIIRKANEEVTDINFNRDEVNVVTVGRLVKQKGYDRLIRCCSRLINKDNIKFKVYIIGEGNERSNLEKMIYENNLTDSVKLIGFRDNPYKYIKKADIYVLSSYDESFSLVVGEAIILEKVIVATECAGINEWLCDNKYGLMCNNNEDDLYKALKQVLSNSKLYNYYSKSVKERVNTIDFKRSLNKFEEILC